MNNADTPSFPDFGKLVPGFDFLQNLAKQAAGSAAQKPSPLSGLAGWVAPTLNVEDLEKRIQELKTVQFWLDQNATALKATIQALELQKMTLATLKGMNFNMAEVANAFKLKVNDSLAGSLPRVPDKGKTFAGLEIPPSIFQAQKAQAQAETEAAAKPASSKSDADETPAAAGVADPMQWWGSLTQQFQTIAAEAMKEAAKTSTLEATKSLATGITKDAVKTATELAKGMAETASKTMAGGARAAMNTALASSWPKPGDAKAASWAAPKATASKAVASKTAAKPKPKAPARKTAGTAARKTAR